MFLIPQDSWKVKSTKAKGRGIFAKATIKSGTIIGDYIGRVIRTAEENTIEGDEGLYLMYYHDHASIYPEDITSPGVHLLNHSCTPNAWMYTYHGHTLFFALRHIFAGEEITVSYLLGPGKDCDKPCKHTCHCKTPQCTGSMHLSEKRFEAWNAFNLKQMGRTKPKRITYGDVLPKLDVYPKTIADNPIYDLFGSCEKEPFLYTENILPTIAWTRKLIRQTGLTVLVTKHKLHILGVQNNQLVT